jgi:hypothetical protein
MGFELNPLTHKNIYNIFNSWSLYYVHKLKKKSSEHSKCDSNSYVQYTYEIIYDKTDFGIIDTSTIKCWVLSAAQAGARGRQGCRSYSLSLMYRLDQTESAIFM